MKRLALIGTIALAAILSTPAFARDGISVLAGRAVSNSITDQKSTAWNVEQETPTRYGTWLFGYLNEGHQLNQFGGNKRDGIYAQYQMSYELSPHIKTSFDLGPYFTANTITEPDGIHYHDAYGTALLATAEVEVKLAEKVDFVTKWDHALYTPQHKDADIFLFGFEYHPTW